MKCTEIGEQLMDVLAGIPAEPQVAEHLRTCGACTERLESLQSTMSLLDEWQAPEPSPYFDVRLQARLREEAARPQGWFTWLRRPTLAVAMAVLLVIGGMLIVPGGVIVPSESITQLASAPGTAVGDLQTLDKNQDLFASFDMLDDLSDNEAPSVTP